MASFLQFGMVAGDLVSTVRRAKTKKGNSLELPFKLLFNGLNSKLYGKSWVRSDRSNLDFAESPLFIEILAIDLKQSLPTVSDFWKSFVIRKP